MLGDKMLKNKWMFPRVKQVPEEPLLTKNTALEFAHGCSPGLVSKTLLLKILYTSVTGDVEIKLVLTWKLSLCLLAFRVPRKYYAGC